MTQPSSLWALAIGLGAWLTLAGCGTSSGDDVRCDDGRCDDTCIVPAALETCQLHAVTLEAGRARLAGATAGSIQCSFDVVASSLEVDADASAASPRTWPAVAGDVITQARYRHADGSTGAWQPADVLEAGGFDDSAGDGIPDLTNLLVGAQTWEMFVDVDTVGTPPPDQNWFTLRTAGTFVDADHPPGAARSLHLTSPQTGTQYLATLGKALVPPLTTWTLSGWNRYDVPVATSGAMARFNELDATGAHTTKYVLIGDDDFDMPVGTTGWTWRALTFTTEPSTTGLNIVPARLNTIAGEMWASNWQLREDAVYGTAGARVVFEESFATLDGWQLDNPAITQLASVDGHPVMQLDPAPHVVATAIQRQPIAVTPGKLYAFRAEMENRAAASYDRTHQAWMSTYLEFLDAGGRVIDHVKVQTFRPVFERPVGAAIVAPAGAVAARFMLVASHTSYAPEPLEQTMTALFGSLRLEESTYQLEATHRASSLVMVPDPDAVATETRTRLLTDDPAVAPSLGGIQLKTCE
jgi:hypothetical protein